MVMRPARIAVLIFSAVLCAACAQEASAQVTPSTGTVAQGTMVPGPRSSAALVLGTTVQGLVVDVEQVTGAAAYISPLPSGPQSAYKGGCNGGSLQDMMASHGTEWGYIVPSASAAFTLGETYAVYDHLSSYFACVAVSSAAPDLCAGLPAAAEGGGLNIARHMSPGGLCAEKVQPVLFNAYMAGLVEDERYCGLIEPVGEISFLADVPSREFCAAAAKGIENVLPVVTAYAPEHEDVARKHFPPTLESCDGDPKCVRMFSLYTALKSGTPADCSAEERPYCEAILSRSTEPCEAMLVDMSAAYCSFLKELKFYTGKSAK